MSPDEVIEIVSPIFARTGSAWYFRPETLAAGRAVGLDGMRFYVLGRGGVLGAVDWQIVASAFGYFNPSMLERLWTTANERADRASVVAAHLGACADFARLHLAGIDQLGRFCAAAESVMAAAVADPGGLTLFAGYAAQPLPGDLPARAGQLVATLRELRGSAHLASVVAVGLPTPVAHALRRPTDGELFGWKPGTVPDPDDNDRLLLADADRLTGRVLARFYGAVTDEERSALALGAQAVDRAVPNH